MEMVSPYIVWNVLITLILAPIWFQIRQNAAELKRQDILINKTREEVAKEYVTKLELKDDFNLLMAVSYTHLTLPTNREV